VSFWNWFRNLCIPKPKILLEKPPVSEPNEPQLASFYAFENALGHRESGNNYTIVNEYGYLGRFQFGMARLCDFGLTERKPNLKGYSNKCFQWVPPFSKEVFLAHPRLQDKLFELHVSTHAKRILKVYPAWVDTLLEDGTLLTLSGIVACFHLLGEGGFKHWIDGEDTADAMGTMASDYLEKFSGYEIPLNLQTPAEVDLKEYVGTTS